MVEGESTVNCGCPYFVSEGVEGADGGCGSHALLGFGGDGFVEAHEEIGGGFLGVVDALRGVRTLGKDAEEIELRPDSRDGIEAEGGHDLRKALRLRSSERARALRIRKRSAARLSAIALTEHIVSFVSLSMFV